MCPPTCIRLLLKLAFFSVIDKFLAISGHLNFLGDPEFPLVHTPLLFLISSPANLNFDTDTFKIFTQWQKK